MKEKWLVLYDERDGDGWANERIQLWRNEEYAKEWIEKIKKNPLFRDIHLYMKVSGK